GLFFERDWSFGEKNFTHTFEPRAFYLYTPFDDQTGIGIFDTSTPTFNFTQLFSRNRFAGIDRIGDANQISAAITSRLIDDKGVERVNFTFGRIAYLQDRKVQLLDSTPRETFRQSGLLAEINWRWTDRVEVKGAIDWDDQRDLTQSGSFLLHYEPKENHIINIGHRFRRNFNRKIEEAEVAFAWPIKENWRILGRYSRDLSQNRTNESFFGLEYESCCWAVRLVNRRYLNIQLDTNGQLIANQGDLHNSGVFVQFVLKGIGSLRGSTTEFLEESIYGYRDRLGK
ncbi:MAG: LPS assembly protein LptD, partial [Gammaproteobacteria bacterium]|nr:LPS assembly protein LptD [Gammaproteobacteria bacterium]